MGIRGILSFTILGQILFFTVTNGKPTTSNPDPDPDFDSAASPNPELGSYFEGDIILADEDELTGKVGLKDEKYRWEDNTVPFTIATGFSEDEEQLILDGIEELGSKTCINFVEQTSEVDYVEFVPHSDACASTIGRRGGKQNIMLAPGCFKVGKGTVMHEMMHTLGFFHEHTRPDRDDYVQIHTDRILKSALGNFVVANVSEVSYFNVSYDYGSIMHYPKVAFPIEDGMETISVKTEGATIGQRIELSPKDIQKLNRMYKCMENTDDDFVVA